MDQYNSMNMNDMSRSQFRIFSPLVIMVCVTLQSRLCLADAVTTSDGSRFVGTIVQMADGSLTIETSIAGTLIIDASMITSIETEESINVAFDSGDQLVGSLSSSEAQDASTIETALGSLSVEPTRITSMWRVGQESPEMLAIRAETNKQIEALKPKWTATLEAGGVFKDGNTDRLDGRGRFDVERKTNEDLLKFFLAAEYSEQSKVRTTNEYRGGVLYENQINKKWYWYTRLELEFDEFENLDLRSTAAAGVGYYWLRKPDHELKNRMGLGYRHESFTNGMTRNEAVIDLGVDYRIDVAPWLRFTHSGTYSPDFEDTDNYRLDFDTAAVLPFQNDALKLKIGMRNEYNSRPSSGLDRLDNIYYANLLIELVQQ